MLNKFNKKKMRGLKLVDQILKVVYHTKKNSRPILKETIKEIIILDFTAIGDMVMLIPFLTIIRKNYPFAKITLVCGKWGKEILGDQNLVETFIICNGMQYLSTPKKMIQERQKLGSVIKKINQKKYDLALEPRGDIRHIYFMHFIHANRKISYNYTGGTSLLTDAIIPSKQVTHLIEDKLYFLKKLGCQFEGNDQYPVLRLTEKEKRLNQEYLIQYSITNNTIITGIHPGARDYNRQWKQYGELLEKLYSYNKNQLFLLFEGPGESRTIASLAEKAKSCEANFIISKTGLREYRRLIALCSRIVCNDSGAGHIAAAYGVPVTILFGPAIPENVKPYGLGNITCISYPVPCKPCHSTLCKNKTLECLRRITIDEVVDAVERRG